ncbi:BCCT family transporter [Kushneria indalinina]|uniref:BCCT family betaine/carnitine transporter n=1 Tax=Kushneria indalinina DSM 14324 TaxID=1122140 RepID=A0A3D9DY78_9GAMM|nr:BCCT family transporter [Kushneria indalinina]REC95309.1 BCCT family betaine/carnitine transporter [Kushneria indalinina DSM 14324]
MLKRIDWPTFIGAFVLLLSVAVPLVLFPEAGARWVLTAKNVVTEQLGVLYLLLGVVAMGFMVYVVFSNLGQIKLGEADERAEFRTWSWAAMLFCGGIGASILYWSVIEWMYYIQSPPFEVEPMSNEAARWASTYGIFHWGIVTWSIYLIPSLPMAYFLHVRKRSVLKVSQAMLPVLGEKLANGWLGKLIDILFIFGLMAGTATTLGLAAPLINEGAHQMFGVPLGVGPQLIVLLICTAIFGWSAWSGLKKGIKILSDINLWLAIGLLIFVFVLGPTLFMANTGLDAIGRMLSNLIRMATWTEPFGGIDGFPDSSFPQDWTMFYWAWWLVFSPTMGFFVARISRGRTVRQMVAGGIFFGSLGCAAFFITLGNFGLYMQMTGQLDAVSILNDQGPTAAMFAVLHELPMAWIAIAAFTLLAILFTATSFDSTSYILAAAVETTMEGGEPMRWNRLFWALSLSILPAVLMWLGGLETLQTASVVGGLPLLPIAVLLMVSFVRAAKYDLRYQPDYSDPEISIEAFPRHDPWTQKGNWSNTGDDTTGR